MRHLKVLYIHVENFRLELHLQVCNIFAVRLCQVSDLLFRFGKIFTPIFSYLLEVADS
jgi:hypothetical protein